MNSLKTLENSASVSAFIKALTDPQRRADAEDLLQLFAETTEQQPRMWGDSIIGFGKIHYRYASGREGDWMATGFSPRKRNLSLYVLHNSPRQASLLNRLGRHKRGVGCLYINRLQDIDQSILRTIIDNAYQRAIRTNSIC